MDLLETVKMDNAADTQFRITWPCFRDAGEEDKDEKDEKDDDDDEDKPVKKERKKKRKKKKRPPPPCAACRLGPEGAARSHVRRAGLWCCARCCLVCCSALRVLITVVGVVGICLAAFYILSPGDSKSDGARVVRAGLRALGARARGGRARARPLHAAGPLQPVTTECGPDCPGGRTGCPGGRPDCPGGGPDGSDCGPGCPGGKSACLGRKKDRRAGSPDIEVVAGPFQVVDSSVIVTPHDPEAPDEPQPLRPADTGATEDPGGAATPDDQGDDGPSSPGDLEAQKSDVANEPED